MSCIKSKKELGFFLMADMMINRGYFKKSLKNRIKDFFIPDLIMDYLSTLRKASYYSQKSTIRGGYYKMKARKLGMKLGFTIEYDVFGYGLLIPHYGTIVVGKNTIGNYAVLQSSICISGNEKTIGDCLYVATGAKIIGKCVLGDNIMVGANAVVTKSYPKGNVVLTGIPALPSRDAKPWYETQGAEFRERVKKIEQLRSEMNL